MCCGDQTQLLLFGRQEKLSPTAEMQNLVRKERRWTVVHTCNLSFEQLREVDHETLSKVKSKGAWQGDTQMDVAFCGSKLSALIIWA